MGARKNRPDKYGTAAKRAEAAAVRAKNSLYERATIARLILRLTGTDDQCVFTPPYYARETLSEFVREGLLTRGRVDGTLSITDGCRTDLASIAEWTWPE